MEYLHFEELERKTKTKLFAIKNKLSGLVLGSVKWYAPWRRYCFFPTHANLVFDAGCLSEINNFINKLMEERKKEADSLPVIECNKCTHHGEEECPYQPLLIDENTVLINGIKKKIICYSGFNE